MANWTGDSTTFLKGLDLVASRLKKQRDSFKATAEKKKEKLVAKLGDLATEEDIQTAYGYADITDTERIALLLLLQESKETQVAEDAAVFYLTALLRDLANDRTDWVENMERNERERRKSMG